MGKQQVNIAKQEIQLDPQFQELTIKDEPWRDIVLDWQMGDVATVQVGKVRDTVFITISPK